jgi:hypothetical protein
MDSLFFSFFQILNDCDVDSAGDENSLEKTCAGVLEIDLAHNRLSEWSEVSIQ